MLLSAINVKPSFNAPLNFVFFFLLNWRCSKKKKSVSILYINSNISEINSFKLRTKFIETYLILSHI